MKTLIGIDEVGRGPLAGPVCVCAVFVIADHAPRVRRALRGITDSKKLSAAKREEWLVKIDTLRREGLLDYTCAFVGQKIIDQRGMSHAIRTAINRTLRGYRGREEHCDIKLDGLLHAPHTFIHQKTIIGGDEKEWIISTASVIAKVKRDRKMERLAKKYPLYGFDIHKGYGTQKHREAIRTYGMCELHRQSYCTRIKCKK